MTEEDDSAQGLSTTGPEPAGHRRAGDHVATRRSTIARWAAFDHHGIVLDDSTVFEVQRRGCDIVVGPVPLEEFARGGPVITVTHGRLGLAGVFAPAAATQPDTILGRTRTLLLAQQRGILGRYALLGRNCEHLVNWCIAGDLDSVQVRRRWFGEVSAGMGLVFMLCLAALRRGAVRPSARRALGWLVAAASLVKLTHTASLHWQTRRLSFALAELDRERRQEESS